MRHPDLDELYALALGELPAAREGEVRSHVDICRECRLEVDAVARVRGSLPSAVAVPEHEVASARARLEAALARQWHPTVLTSARRRMVTATLLAASVLGLLVLRSYVRLELPPVPARVQEWKDTLRSRLTLDALPGLPFAKEKSGA